MRERKELTIYGAICIDSPLVKKILSKNRIKRRKILRRKDIEELRGLYFGNNKRSELIDYEPVIIYLEDSMFYEKMKTSTLVKGRDYNLIFPVNFNS